MIMKTSPSDSLKKKYGNISKPSVKSMNSTSFGHLLPSQALLFSVAFPRHPPRVTAVLNLHEAQYLQPLEDPLLCHFATHQGGAFKLQHAVELNGLSAAWCCLGDLGGWGLAKMESRWRNSGWGRVVIWLHHSEKLFWILKAWLFHGFIVNPTVALPRRPSSTLASHLPARFRASFWISAKHTSRPWW